MKILQINNNHYRKSGTDSVYLNLINLLRFNGHEVIAFSFHDDHNLNEPFNDYFVEKKFLSNSFGKFYSFSAKNNLEKLILNHKPDIAHFHNIIGGLSLSILPLLKKYNIPVVVTIHGFKYLCPAYIFINGKGDICEDCKGGKYFKCVTNNCSPEGIIKSFALAVESYTRNLFLPFHKYIDNYIFLSQFFRNKFIEHYPSIADKSIFFYNFIDKIIEIPKTTKGDYFLYFGRLDREKGIKTLIEAFSINQHEKLKIIGTGQLTEYVIKNKTFNVEFLGYKNWNILKEYIINASFIIVPSECYENNPMTIIEAYSLGKPVIGSNIGGIPEIILPGKTGYTFEPKNVKELSNIIQTASEININSFDQLSRNSVKFAQENFSSEIFYKKLMDVYSSVIK
ncbi:MAG: glycosyltransferase family 4 protein [Ignavibacteriaceae bacterium]